MYFKFDCVYYRTETTLLQTLSRGLQMSEEDINRIVPMLSVFCSMFSHSLYTLHDADFYGETFNGRLNMNKWRCEVYFK